MTNSETDGIICLKARTLFATYIIIIFFLFFPVAVYGRMELDMKTKNLFPKLLFTLTVTAIVCGLSAGIALPWILRAYFDFIHVSVNMNRMLLLLYTTYVPFMVIWAAVFKLCRNLANDRPFCENSILNLKVISICSFFDFVIFIAGTLIYMRMAFFILAGAALMIAVISAIIRELVIRGIELREEVDLTI